MAFLSVAFSIIAILLLTEQGHARPAISAPPTPSTPAGCEYDGKFFQPGEMVYKEECSSLMCTEYGLLISDKECFFTPPT